MTRLVSTKTELTVLRGLCSKNRKISGKLLAATDETYFHNEEAVDGYKKIRRHILKDGAPPLWRDLLEDPSLSSDTREFLGQNEVLLKTAESADSAIGILNKYRQLRGLYLMGENIIQKLQEKRVDEEALLEHVSDTITKLRMNKSLEDLALHFGKNNNSYELVKSLLYDEEEMNYVPTGFRDFDIKNGGFFFKSLVILGGSTGAGKCLVGQTEVTKADKSKITLETIWKTAVGKEVAYYEEGQVIGTYKDITLDISTYEGDAIADRVFKTKGKTLRITLEDGTVIEGLPEHKLLVKNVKDIKPHWVCLSSLCEGDETLYYEEIVQHLF